MDDPLDYKEPKFLPPEPITTLEQAWGKLPNSRWSHVGRMVQIKVFDDATAATTGDGKAIFLVPPELDGTQLVRVVAYVTTASASGGPVNIQVRNVTQSKDMLTAAVTIDDTELSSKTAATPPVIDSSIILRDNDQVAIDVDTAGSEAKGLGVHLSIQ